MIQGENFAILSTIIKLPFIIKTFVLPIFEWPFYTGFTLFGTLIAYRGYITTNVSDYRYFIEIKCQG